MPMRVAPSVSAGGGLWRFLREETYGFLPGYQCQPRELMVALDLVKKQRESPDWWVEITGFSGFHVFRGQDSERLLEKSFRCNGGKSFLASFMYCVPRRNYQLKCTSHTPLSHATRTNVTRLIAVSSSLWQFLGIFSCSLFGGYIL